MADERGGISGSQVTVALIGAAAVIGSALIANSDRLFGAHAGPTPTPTPIPSPVPTPSASGIMPSPSASASEEPAPAPAGPTMAGGWTADDGTYWQFAQDGDRFGASKAQGVEKITVEGTVSGRSVRLWVDYSRTDTGAMGLRIVNCDGQFENGGQQLQLSCINPQTNVTSRPVWSRT